MTFYVWCRDMSWERATPIQSTSCSTENRLNIFLGTMRIVRHRYQHSRVGKVKETHFNYKDEKNPFRRVPTEAAQKPLLLL